jgi:hypothetical protein
MTGVLKGIKIQRSRCQVQRRIRDRDSKESRQKRSN